jgi:hypothetical protein
MTLLIGVSPSISYGVPVAACGGWWGGVTSGHDDVPRVAGWAPASTAGRAANARRGGTRVQRMTAMLNGAPRKVAISAADREK